MHEPYWTSDDIKFLTECGVEVEEYSRILPDAVLDFMIKHRIPLTRENYIAINFMGVPEEEIGGELEFEMPAIFRKEAT